MWRRVLQVAGFTLAVTSLASYWVLATDGPRQVARPNLTVENHEVPTFTAVLAGRDVRYCKPGYGPGGIKAVPCTGPDRFSDRTDTIMVLRVSPGGADVISVPRDTAVETGGRWHKVNDSYAYGGATALESAVESLIGTNIDYYAIVNIDFVERVIDALGGIDVYLPTRMDYDDFAANLHVHIPEGNQHLNGAEAVGYLRVRKGYGDDYARMDRSKEAVGKLLEKLKSPAGLTALPTILAGLTQDVETNMDLELIRALATNARGLTPHFATLPTREPGPLEQSRLGFLGSYLVADEAAIDSELGAALGKTTGAPGDARTVPSEPALIVNATGVDGLARALAALFKRSGLPEPRVETGPATDSLTQVLRSRAAGAEDAELYARFMRVPVFVPNTAPDAPIVIYLGRDAARRYAALVAEAGAIARNP